MKTVRLLLVGGATLAVACLAGVSPAGAQSPAAKREALEQRVTEANVRAELFALAADSMEGRMTASPGGARAARYIAAQMKAAGLRPAGDSGGYLQRVPVLTGEGSTPRSLESFAVWNLLPENKRGIAYNVIGILDGERSDSAVVVDAHYDHLGTVGHGPCRALGADSICNGADDDASGTVAVIEIAKALASGQKPHRTIVFVATTGEEVGLIGTRWYIAHPAIPLDKMTANLEIEMIDRPDSLAGGPGRAWLTGYDRSSMGDMLAVAGLPVVPDKRLCQGFFERSDNIAFARAGIPAHTLSTFDLHADYHRADDDARLADIPHMTGVIRAAVGAVDLLGNGPAPQWYDGRKPPAVGRIAMVGCPGR
ncbi:MAG: peptidase [Gemmatimonadetes bacterium]|nr:peptidase [Gemmatimonadota bacterium]